MTDCTRTLAKHKAHTAVQTSRAQCAVAASQQARPSLWAQVTGSSRSQQARQQQAERERAAFDACMAAAAPQCAEHAEQFCNEAFDDAHVAERRKKRK